MSIRRQYVDFTEGQLHLLTAGMDQANKPLICFHMSPYSSAYYSVFMEAMAEHRPIICPDTPGYGGSDPLAAPSIEGYAAAMIEMMDALSVGDADLLGFHTGVFTAIELAHRLPDRIGKLVIPGIPYMKPDDRLRRVSMFDKDKPYFTEPDHMQKRWSMGLEAQGDKTNDRVLELFAESLRPGISGTNKGFLSVFKYDPDPIIPAIAQPVYIPVPDEMLAQNSRDIAPTFKDATLEEWPDMGPDLFDVDAIEVARLINVWLER